MDVSQELGSTAISTSGYVCDGWKLFNNTTAVVSAGRSAGAITGGYPNHLYVAVGTALAAGAAADIVTIQQYIEGSRLARLQWGASNAQPLTIAFWTGHHRTGLYSGSIRNGDSSRSYVFTYTQNAPDISQFNVVTIPGDTVGTWNIDNTVGMIVTFALAVGTQFTAPAPKTWYSANYTAAPGQVNAAGATTDVFRITGVVVLPGIEAPSAARSPFIMRPYDQELLLCKRYFQKVYVAVETVAAFQSWAFPVSFRSNPTVSGGGAGFFVSSPDTQIANFQQTARAYQTLLMDARL
jgi:hypothetical protein